MLKIASKLASVTAILAIGLAASLVTMDYAEARRGGGGFGSRGVRTYQAPAPTRTAPNNAAPIERSMTPNTGAQQTNRAGQTQNAAPAANAARQGGMFGGFGRSMLGGLVMGGLLGMLLGQGFGGMAGFFGMILQIAIIAGIAMLAMRFFANRRQTATAGAGASAGNSSYRQAQNFGNNTSRNTADSASFGSSKAAEPVQATAPVVDQGEPIEIEQADLDQFEQMLKEVQTAYANEDYAALRALSTPEAMSYLAEELGEIASSGMRNKVSDVKLLQGDISEAWSEGTKEYATVAMRYESIDVMVDRTTGAVLEGNADTPTETIELWTFVRDHNHDGRGEWQLSAIQEAS